VGSIEWLGGLNMFDYFKKTKPNELSKEELSDVINGFSVFVEHAEINTFYDVDKLYHPKGTIQFALIAGIANGDTREFRAECEVALTILAQFHEGVGAEALRNSASDQIQKTAKLHSEGSLSADEVLNRIASAGDPDGNSRWNMFNKVYKKEAESLLRVIQTIKDKTNNH
jgi:hypothetical protein